MSLSHDRPALIVVGHRANLRMRRALGIPGAEVCPALEHGGQLFHDHGRAYRSDMRDRFPSILVLAGLSAYGWSLDITFERMDYRKHGNLIVLPSEAAAFPGRFVLDSGCTTLVLDEHFVSILGPEQGKREVDVGGVPTDLHWFLSPALHFGAWELPAGQMTFCSSLVGISQAGGFECSGMAGLSDLQRLVMTVDYDRDRLRLSDDVTPVESALVGWLGIDMAFDDVPKVLTGTGNWLPWIRLTIAGEEVTAMVDTGYNGSLELDTDIYDRLVGLGRINGKHEGFAGTAIGQVATNSGLIESVGLSSLSYPALEVDRAALQTNATIGAKFLSRHNLIFDFPHRRLCFQPRASMMTKPDVQDQSGVHILQIAGKITVHSIDANSPAERAGLHAGDQVRVIDGQEAVSIGPFECRELFAESGKRPLSLVIVRDGADRTITLLTEH